MIKLVILVLLLLLLTYALKQYQRSRVLSVVILLCSLIGMLLVWMPELSTAVAHFLGVGRGVDLITYLFIIIAIAAIFNVHLRLRANNEVMTRIVRELAIRNAGSSKGGEQ